MTEVSDDEYLDTLLAALVDEAPEVFPALESRPAIPKELVRHWLRERRRHAKELGRDDVRSDEIDEADLHLPATHREVLRGRRVQLLRRMAKSFLGECTASLESVPVGCVPLVDVGACSVRTPQNGAVVLLNQGLETALGLFVSCLWTYMEARKQDTTTEIADEAFHAIEAMAIVVSASPGRTLENWGTHPLIRQLLGGPSKAEVFAAEYVSVAQTFVLLHEYGHIILGHLKPANVERKLLGQSVGVDVYQTNRGEEFAADEFAASRIVTSMRDAGYPTTAESALAIGMLFKYFEMRDICFRVNYAAPNRTHPPPRERWAKVHQLFDVGPGRFDALTWLDQNLALLRDTLTDLVAQAVRTWGEPRLERR